MIIYELNDIYYLKSGESYEIADISIKYSRIKKRNVLVITGSKEYVSSLDCLEEYTFKELEEKLCGGV